MKIIRDVKNRRWIHVILTAACLITGLVRGQNGEKVYIRPSIDALKTETPPVIDGRLDDPVWEKARGYTDFRTFEPDYGVPISETTIGYAAYDDKNLYFAFDCKDSRPGDMIASMTKRDNIFDQDLVAVFLDSYNDLQGAYVFFVNPFGIQGDIIMDANGSGSGASADFVWESGGRIYDDADLETSHGSSGSVGNGETGYQVEIKIPLKSIRFKSGERVPMGIGFHRQITRTRERTMFPEIVAGRGSLIAQSGIITYQDLFPKRVFELLPVMTWTQRNEHQNGSMAMLQNQGEFGLTGKLGLTSTLTMDAAYNPDFSQIEADAGQVDVNLRYDLFFEEKRPFFMEGIETFAIAGPIGSMGSARVLHTRNIADPIMGLKVSGKMGTQNTLATIFAVDESPTGEKGQNATFGIVRYKRSMGYQESYVGGILAGRGFNKGYNWIGGVDFFQRINDENVVSGNIMEAWNREEAVGRQSTGHSIGVQWKYQTEALDIMWRYSDIGKGFRMDTGYVPRNGTTTLELDVMPTFFFNSPGLKKIIRRIRTGYYLYILKDHYYNMYENMHYLYTTVDFPYSSYIRLNAAKSSEVFAARSFDTDFFRIQVGNRPPWLQADIYAQFRIGGYPYYDPDDPFQGDRTLWVVGVGLSPTDDIRANLSYVRSIFNKRSDGEQLYDYRLYRGKLTYQINKYLFLRAIGEYNDYSKVWITDFLVSFTYIPGTVLHIGYGSRYDKLKYVESDYFYSNRYMEMKRGFFAKASYNWIF